MKLPLLIKIVKVLSLGVLLLASLPVRSEELKANQASAELLYLQGVHFAESGDAASAEIAFRNVRELDQANPLYVQGLTVLYIHNHQFAKALEILRVYVKRSGPTALGWTLQGELLFEQRNMTWRISLSVVLWISPVTIIARTSFWD